MMIQTTKPIQKHVYNIILLSTISTKIGIKNYLVILNYLHIRFLLATSIHNLRGTYSETNSTNLVIDASKILHPFKNV